MARPELDILTSTEGQRMLNYDTAGFYNQSYTALWLFQVMGMELDLMRQCADDVKRQSFPQTADWSLEHWEFAYGIPTDERLSIDKRRKQILAKTASGIPINPERIRLIAEELSGVPADVAENIAPYTFAIKLYPRNPFVDGYLVWNYIKKMKPSHLSMEIVTEVSDTTNIYVGVALTNSNTTIFLEQIYGTPSLDDSEQYYGMSVYSGGIIELEQL